MPQLVAPNPLFATYETPEEPQAYFDMHTGSDKAMLMMGAVLMNNCIAHQLNTPDVTVDEE